MTSEEGKYEQYLFLRSCIEAMIESHEDTMKKLNDPDNIAKFEARWKKVENWCRKLLDWHK